jgi:hypothetical protein
MKHDLFLYAQYQKILGLDSESRPILALCADHLPNPDLYDYDLILS